MESHGLQRARTGYGSPLFLLKGKLLGSRQKGVDIDPLHGKSNSFGIISPQKKPQIFVSDPQKMKPYKTKIRFRNMLQNIFAAVFLKVSYP